MLTFVAHEEAGAPAGSAHAVLAGGSPSGAHARSQQAIGEALRIDRTTMVSLVDQLERRGLVRRERNPADRRAYTIGLTAEGRDLQRNAEAALDAAAAEFFGALSEHEQIGLCEQLGRLVERSRAGAGRMRSGPYL